MCIRDRWYTKGKYTDKWIGIDLYRSDAKDQSLHKWGQNVSAFEDLTEALCLPGDIVLDPFCGGGTTGAAAIASDCYFIGSDIDKDSIKITKNRLNGRV